MAAPNPITTGPRAVFRDPVIIMLELLWRLCFGGIAVAVMVAAAVALSNALTITDSDATALRSRDALQITLALRHAVFAMPLQPLLLALVALLLVTVLWIFFSAAGRLLILSRVAPEKCPFRYRSILVVQSWRAVLGWLAILAIAALVGMIAGIAGKKNDPDPYFFYLVGASSSFFMAVFWAGMNWYLSLATIFCYAGTRARGAIRETIGWVHVRAADLAGISAVFFLFRLAFMAITFVLFLLPSSFIAAWPRATFRWAALVGLFYFAGTDFLNLSRLLSYMSVDDAVAEEIAQTPLGGPGPSRRMGRS